VPQEARVLPPDLSEPQRYSITLYPTTIDVYESFEVTPPVLLENSPYIALAAFIIVTFVALNFLNKAPDYKRVDAIVSKYKTGEMIKAKDLRDNKYTPVILIILFVLASMLVLTTILSLDSLLNSIEDYHDPRCYNKLC
jgi:hypothetical protein